MPFSALADVVNRDTAVEWTSVVGLLTRVSQKLQYGSIGYSLWETNYSSHPQAVLLLIFSFQLYFNGFAVFFSVFVKMEPYMGAKIEDATSAPVSVRF